MANVAKYGKPEEMEKRIDEYFAQFEKPEPLTDDEGRVKLDKYGRAVMKDKAPTQAGLALYLGFSDRRTMWGYGDKPSFARVIQKAKTLLEKHLEEYAIFGRNSGVVPYLLGNLRNGWIDPKEEAAALANKAPKTALVVYVNAQTKNRKAAEIPTIEAEVVGSKTESATDAVTIAKPKKKVSHGKKLGRPKKSAKAKKTAKSTE